jgi:hypothetical protein
VSTGVVRIDVETCRSGGTGAGFLLAPNLVATVAHVVEGAQSIRVTSPQSSTAAGGTVVGLDHDQDLALVQLDANFPGHQFTLASTQPAIGTEIGTVGFPLGGSMQLTTGHITQAHDHRTVAGDDDEYAELSDLLITDAVQNPGNSGGPWLTRDGQVAALSESGPPYDPNSGERAQGNNAGVPAADAVSEMRSWQQSPDSLSPSPCAKDSYDATDPEQAALATLSQFYWDINKSDYASAYAQYTAEHHKPGGLQEFIKAERSSQITAPDDNGDSPYAFEVDSTEVIDGQVHADVRFTSRQQSALGQNGDTCTEWKLEYIFEPVNGLWLIKTAYPYDGTTGHQACPSPSPSPSPSDTLNGE